MTSVFGAAKPCSRKARLGGFTDDPALLCGTLADQITDHGEPRGDAEPHAQILPRRQSADRLYYRQPSAHRPLGIILMRLRIAEIDQHPVAHVLGDKPVRGGTRRGSSRRGRPRVGSCSRG
jgi:hypothetical protein